MSSRIRSDPDDGDLRTVSLGPGLPAIPEHLLLAHARGEVLFICGAGISLSAGLPNFRDLVCAVYGTLDPTIHQRLRNASRDEHARLTPDFTGLTYRQTAEVKRFVHEDYDVVLGMLERRLDGDRRTYEDSKVRSTVVTLLRSPNRWQELARLMRATSDVAGEDANPPQEARPSEVHHALMRLADRGGAATIVTTNFDLLLEAAAKRLGIAVETYALGEIPRPTTRKEFTGVLHIHGALSSNLARISDLVLSDQDFGEFYLRRRIVPDFIYDAARLFHLVLVGYSLNDPPMRYLLNAVAADEARFDDVRKRFIFFGTDEFDPVEMEDWRGRGILPIHYPAPHGDHSVLRDTLMRWADLSAINGKKGAVDKEVRRIVKTARGAAMEADRGLFDHLFRRSSTSERVRLAELASTARADSAWLDAMMAISRERDRERGS